MAKKKGPRLDSPPRKGQLAKKSEIDKLIEASQGALALGKNELSGPPKVRLPKSKKSSSKTLQEKKRASSEPIGRAPAPPKKVIPGLIQDSRCRFPEHLILDIRHLHPEAKTPLIRLPVEPPVQRGNRHFVPKGFFPFEELAGELRNKIYEYAIPKDRFHIGWVNGTQRSKTLTYDLAKNGYRPRLQPDVVQRRRQAHIPSHPAKRQIMDEIYETPSPLSLALVNKALYEEASSFFYSRSVFCFDKTRTLRHFLDNMSETNRASIATLRLKHTPYGHPLRTEDQVWKNKADRAWEDMCWRISDECTGLRTLKLDLKLLKSPLTFGPLEEAHRGGWATKWMLPLWAFQDVGITRCYCRLRCPAKDETVLEVESWKVRKEILGEKWNDDEEARRDAYGNPEEKPAKPKRFRVLTLDTAGAARVFFP